MNIVLILPNKNSHDLHLLHSKCKMAADEARTTVRVSSAAIYRKRTGDYFIISWHAIQLRSSLSSAD